MQLKLAKSWIAGLMVAAIAVLFAGCGEGAGNAENITIKGSDTMVHLNSAWAEAYMAQHKEVRVSVDGGGSGTGISALTQGTADIAAASRKMKPEEMETAKTEAGITPVQHIVGYDGIAVVVNPNNPIDALSKDQLKGIYTGKITNWKDVGGPDHKITVLSRESNSGTYVYFKEAILDNEDYTASAQRLASTSLVINSVREDAWVIGYVGRGYAENAEVKMLGVSKTAGGEAVLPTNENINNESYMIARPLYFYIAESASPAAMAFINWVKGPEGQKIVNDKGYVPIK